MTFDVPTSFSLFSPIQKLQYAVLCRASDFDENLSTYMQTCLVSADTISQVYDDANSKFECAVQDGRSEIRSGQEDTNLPVNVELGILRYYDAKSVAMELPDGSWVGWVYFYGGGKFGEPEAIPWIESAYAVAVKKEEKVVIVHKFSYVP